MDSLKPVCDGGCETNAGQEVLGFLVEASSDAAPIFEPTEGALDNVAHSVGDGVERRRLTSRHFGRDDGVTGLCGQEGADVIAVVGFVTEECARRWYGRQKRAGTVEIMHITAGQEQSVEAARGVAERVDFGGAPTTRAADCLILLPPFAPAADRCARTAVLSTMARSGGSPQLAKAAYSSCHSPRSLQRLKRLNSVVLGPYSSGRARQRKPSLNRCRMPLMTRRSSTRGLPPKCGSNGSIDAHCPSLSQKSSAMIQALQGASNQTHRSRHNGYTA